MANIELLQLLHDTVQANVKPENYTQDQWFVIEPTGERREATADELSALYEEHVNTRGEDAECNSKGCLLGHGAMLIREHLGMRVIQDTGFGSGFGIGWIADRFRGTNAYGRRREPMDLARTTFDLMDEEANSLFGSSSDVNTYAGSEGDTELASALGRLQFFIDERRAGRDGMDRRGDYDD